MPYQIFNSDGSPLLSNGLADMTVDTTSTSLTLIGRAYANYGQSLNNNLVALLENFASAKMPNQPMKGQLWYNKTANVINVYDGVGTSGFEPLATQSWVQSQISGIAAPTQVSTGSFVGASQNPITLSGDATGRMGDSISSYDIPVVLATVGTAGTYNTVVTDAKGRVTHGSYVAPSSGSTTSAVLSFTGQVTGSGTTGNSVALTIAPNPTINGGLSVTGNVLVGSTDSATGAHSEILFQRSDGQGGAQMYFNGSSLVLTNLASYNYTLGSGAGVLTLDATGNLGVSGSFTAAGNISANTGQIFVGNSGSGQVWLGGNGITKTSIYGTAGLMQFSVAAGPSLNLDGSGNVTVSGTLTTVGGITAPAISTTGSVSIGGNCTVTVNSTLSGTLTVGSDTVLNNGTLYVGKRDHTAGYSGISFLTNVTKSTGDPAISVGTNGQLYVAYTGMSYGPIATVAASDERLKKNISPLKDALQTVHAMEVVNFEFRKDSGYHDGKTHVGFVAQQLLNVVPNAVMEGDIMRIRKEEIVPYLTRAVQQLSEMNEKLMARIETLEAKLKP